MGRTILFVLALGAAVAAPVEGQSSMGVSAVIVEPVTADPVHVQVRAAARGLSVERAEEAGPGGSVLLRRIYVSAGDSTSARIGSERLLQAGGRVVVEEARSLTITRVIAANS